MKQSALLATAAFLLPVLAAGQRSAFELSFTAIDSAAWIQSDSIRIMNRTQDCDTMLYWPDTVLSIIGVGIPEVNKATGSFHVFPNYPNPSPGQTTLSFYVPEKDIVTLVITDLTGRQMIRSENHLDKGLHSFRLIHGGAKICFFNARWQGESRGVKILGTALHAAHAWSLEYLGHEVNFPQIKATVAMQSFAFEPGDSLLLVVYANGLQSGMPDNPTESQDYSFRFATNIPCPGTPTITYQGHVYNTIQIFSQCWLKENLDVGAMINGIQDQTDNGIIEKYCVSNSPDSCSKYGGLYQWDEMMQYTTQQGSQGICPPGWHLPTDEEWKVLEGAVDSQYGIGNSYWDYPGLRGSDAGKNLKTTSGWNNNGNGVNLFGFSALPASYRLTNGNFEVTGIEAVWWTSTPSVPDYAWYRNNHYFTPKMGRFADSWSYKDYGFSARCLRDY